MGASWVDRKLNGIAPFSTQAVEKSPIRFVRAALFSDESECGLDVSRQDVQRSCRGGRENGAGATRVNPALQQAKKLTRVFAALFAIGPIEKCGHLGDGVGLNREQLPPLVRPRLDVFGEYLNAKTKLIAELRLVRQIDVDMDPIDKPSPFATLMVIAFAEIRHSRLDLASHLIGEDDEVDVFADLTTHELERGPPADQNRRIKFMAKMIDQLM
ncbi:hypothetical protein [Rathayibacter soli]|uniref:hypothetical protein n=1 Tax=Rathayibacter soli TaxID=3144168 RepID=UPI0027E55CAB|nr:hypothetical protein [Glaciibacter superstes]